MKKGEGEKAAALDRLKPEEAQEVLQRLLGAHPELRGESESLAQSLLGEVSFEDLALEVQDAAESVCPEDVYGRSGRQEWGYVEPCEAAGELLEEAITPFLADMKRRLQMGREADALEICKGIVLGMYALRDATGEVLENVPDWPLESAGWAISIWRAGGDEKKAARLNSAKGSALHPFPPDFVKRYTPKWTRDLDRGAEEGR